MTPPSLCEDIATLRGRIRDGFTGHAILVDDDVQALRRVLEAVDAMPSASEEEWPRVVQALGGVVHEQGGDLLPCPPIQLPDGQGDTGSAWLNVDIFRAIVREALRLRVPSVVADHEDKR